MFTTLIAAEAAVQEGYKLILDPATRFGKIPHVRLRPVPLIL